MTAGYFSIFRWIVAAAAAGIAVVTVMLLRQGSPPETISTDRARLPLQLLADGQEQGFARVTHPGEYRFPADQGAHPDYRTEWWYLTGVLRTDADRHLGLQVILLRLGLRSQPPQRASDWATSAIYAGVFSLSDPHEARLHADQRLSRAAAGLAGARAEPVRLWVENWQLKAINTAEHPRDTNLIVTAGGLQLDLRLSSRQPRVKGNEIDARGTAPPFHFYIRPRVRAAGTVRTEAHSTRVRGSLSLEHAWGELPLPGGPVARDRFTLYLKDGRTLFCVRTHRVDGSGMPTTTALLIDQDQRARALSDTEIELKPLEYWVSPDTGGRYPVRWALRVPQAGLDVELRPYWKKQEGVVWAPFWAGPVSVYAPAAAPGKGFMQLNGYADS